MAKKNKIWEDHYTRKARKEKHPARSVYKLKEMQQKYNVIKKGQRVLDLGCAPGSWLLYAASIVGEKGSVVGIDQKPVKTKVPPHVTTISDDIFSLGGETSPKDSPVTGPFHVVLSDMAPSTTGNKTVDAARSLGLCEAALDIAQKQLVTGGAFICKIFQGGDSKEFMDAVRVSFAKVKIFKPKSSRKASREIFVIGFGKKQEETICQVTANGLQ
jgi:23S rRNA (uridine2552-2'-O)-methyltransferase